jgi:hypothetical protein
MMYKTSLRWLLVLTLLAGLSLACSLLTVGGPKNPSTPTAVLVQPTQPVEPPTPTAAPTTAEAEAASTPGLVAVELKLTDSQMTQYLTDQLKNQTDPVLQNPQVHAHDGVIDVKGQVKRSVITGDVKVTLLPTVDDQGRPHLKIQSADLGPIPVPDSLVEGFSNMIDQSMTANADPGQTGYDVKSIQVFDGYILITALPK